MKLLSLLALLCATVTGFCANPAFQSFDTNDFIVTPSVAHPQVIHTLKSGATNSYTNMVFVFNGVTNYYTNTVFVYNNVTNYFTNYVYQTNFVYFTNTINTFTGVTNNYTNTIENFTGVTNYYTNTIFIVNGTNTDITQLWTNSNGAYLPITPEFNLIATNIISDWSLTTDGDFFTTGQQTYFLTPGVNVIAPARFPLNVLQSTDNSAEVKINAPMGPGQHIWLVNMATNRTFTFNDGPCVDIPAENVRLNGGSWTPTALGETIELQGFSWGWCEVGTRGGGVGPTIAVNTIQDMVNLDPRGGIRFLSVRGYHARDDGGGGNFYFEPTSLPATNMGTAFASPYTSGNWLRIKPNPNLYNVKEYGAYGDAIHDDFLAITNAVSAWGAVYDRAGDDLYFPSGWYICNKPVVLSGVNKTVHGDNNITWIQSTVGSPVMVFGSSYPGAPTNTTHACNNIRVHDLGFLVFGPGDRGAVQVGGLISTNLFDGGPDNLPVTNIDFEHCFFEGGALFAWHMIDSHIRDCYFEGQPYMGIMAFNSARNNVTDCFAYVAGGLLFMGQTQTNGVYNDNYGWIVANNRATLSYEGFASIQYTYDSTFANNICTACGQNINLQPDSSGFFVGVNTGRLRIIDNLIEPVAYVPGVTAGLTNAIRFSDTSTNSLVFGNEISSPLFSSPDGPITIADWVSLSPFRLDTPLELNGFGTKWQWRAVAGKLNLDQVGVDTWMTVDKTNGYIGIWDQNPTARFSVASGNMQVADNGATITKSYFQGHLHGDIGGGAPGYGYLYFRTNGSANEAVLLSSANAGLRVLSDTNTEFYVSPSSGYTGAGTKFLNDSGHYTTPAGGSTNSFTINPTDRKVPYRVDATTLGDSEWLQGTNLMVLQNQGTNLLVLAEDGGTYIGTQSFDVYGDSPGVGIVSIRDISKGDGSDNGVFIRTIDGASDETDTAFFSVGGSGSLMSLFSHKTSTGRKARVNASAAPTSAYLSLSDDSGNTYASINPWSEGFFLNRNLLNSTLGTNTVAKIQYGGTNKFAVLANSGFDGSGNHFLSDDGTYKTVSGTSPTATHGMNYFGTSGGNFTTLTSSSFVPVIFGSDTNQTSLLAAGTYLVTAVMTVNGSSSGTNNFLAMFHETATPADIPASEVGVSVGQTTGGNTARALCNVQAIITLPSSGYIFVIASQEITGALTPQLIVDKTLSNIIWTKLD